MTTTTFDRSLGIALRHAVWLMDQGHIATSQATERLRKTAQQIVSEDPDRRDGDVEIAARIIAAEHPDDPLSETAIAALSATVSMYRSAGPDDLGWLYSSLDKIANFEKHGA